MIIGSSFLFNDTSDVFAVAYDLNVPTGVELPLGGLTLPAVLAGYDTSIFDLTTARTAYAGTSGTIIFDTLCFDGVSGTIPSIGFEEVEGLEEIEDITNPTSIVGGCTMNYTNLTFNFGSCPTGLDAGVADAAMADGGL